MKWSLKRMMKAIVPIAIWVGIIVAIDHGTKAWLGEMANTWIMGGLLVLLLAFLGVVPQKSGRDDLPFPRK